MALDLVSAPCTEAGPPPAKRRRLGWDVPDPAVLAEAACLQNIIATQLLQACPSLFSTQNKQKTGGSGLSSVQEANPDAVNIVDRHGGDVQHHVAPAASPPWHEDDKDGHFNFDLGENLTSRYIILKKMGEGTFGRVLECWDKDAQEVVAIKVVRSADRYREAAMIEIDVLHTLCEKDRTGSRGKARKYFRHERRLNWPDLHTSRERIRAVHRLCRLRVGMPMSFFICFQDLVMENVDKSAGSFVDLLEQMLSYNPSDRPTAKEALRHPFFQLSSSG